MLYNSTHIMRKVIVALVLLAAGLLSPAFSYAQTTLEPGVCTSVYGGGVICGAKHEVVETGLGENLALVGGLSILTSGVLLYFAKRNGKLISQA
jgi:hypothetical protein